MILKAQGKSGDLRKVISVCVCVYVYVKVQKTGAFIIASVHYVGF